MSNFDSSMQREGAGRGRRWQSKGERQIPLKASSLAPKRAVIAEDNTQGSEHRQPETGSMPGAGWLQQEHPPGAVTDEFTPAT